LVFESSQIKNDLAKQFPDKTPPDFPAIAEDSFVSYAYPEANVKFAHPYYQNPRPLQFTDSTGTMTPLTSFGIVSSGNQEPSYLVIGQSEILHKDGDQNRITEFIIHLDRTSTLNQIVVNMCKARKHTRRNNGEC
jgi:hypothetical protein